MYPKTARLEPKIITRLLPYLPPQKPPNIPKGHQLSHEFYWVSLAIHAKYDSAFIYALARYRILRNYDPRFKALVL